jgi:predicted metal-dependent hydrolase
MMKTIRNPQQTLRLETEVPDPAKRWHDGATITHLGREIRLQLDTVGKEAVLDGEILHLPLPPEATPRQIQDRAEAWLRGDARRLLNEVLAEKSALVGRHPPDLALSFAANSSWIIVHDTNSLRCNWRLIEQPRSIIEHAMTRAVAGLPRTLNEPDLFGPLSA